MLFAFRSLLLFLVYSITIILFLISVNSGCNNAVISNIVDQIKACGKFTDDYQILVQY